MLSTIVLNKSVAMGRKSGDDRLEASGQDYKALVDACISYQTDAANDGEKINITKAKRRYAVGQATLAMTNTFKVNMDDLVLKLASEGICIKADADTKSAGVEAITKGRLSSFRTAVRRTLVQPITDEQWVAFFAETRPANKIAKPSAEKLALATARQCVRRFYEAYVDQFTTADELIEHIVGQVTEIASAMLSDLIK